MNLEELIACHEAKKKVPEVAFRLRNKEYRKHYPLIKSAVEKKIPLRSAITILQDKQNAFKGKSTEAVWQAFNRALKHDNVTISK